MELKGDTSFIMVDRNNLLQTGFDELRAIENIFLTLEVQFYGEVCIFHSILLYKFLLEQIEVLNDLFHLECK